MMTAAMASIDDEHITKPIAISSPRARDAAEPWLGHGPRIPDANVREILAVAGRVRELLGPDVDIPDRATTHLRSAEAALTAASERLAEVLRGRCDAPAHTGNGDGIELLLELASVRDRLREAQSLQRIAALSLRMDEPGVAATWLRRAQSASPNDVQITAALADAQLRADDRAGAQATIARGLEKDPENEALLELQRRATTTKIRQ